MRTNILKISVISFLLIIGLFIAGYFSPTSLNWGFHFLGLLPSTYFLVYLILSGLIIAYIFLGDIENNMTEIATKLFHRPTVSVVIALAFFALLAVCLRQKTPLLGDSFVLMNNYQNTFEGLHGLIIYREPLSVYFFYIVASLLGTHAYPPIMNAFLLGEVLLGIGFILNVIFIVKLIIQGSEKRILAVLFLCVGSYMQLFFGYGEIYSVVLFFISSYVLIVVLWMKGKASFYYIPIVFVLMVFAHYLTVLLAPSFLFIVYNEFKRKGVRDIVIGAIVPAAFFVVVLLILKFDFHYFVPPLTHSPFLSVSPSNDDFQPYTLFSAYHLVDLLNLWMLLGASSLILVGLALLVQKKKIIPSLEAQFLLVGIVPVIVFSSLVKVDLGMATDWDTMSSYFFLINLFALIVFINMQFVDRARILFLSVAMTALHSLAWMVMNASEPATVARTKLLADQRVVPHEGYFQISYHLENYYAFRHDLISILNVWDDYIERFPDDVKGYRRAAEYLVKFGDGTGEKTMNLIERWLAINPGDPEPKSALAKVCVNTGNKFLQEGKSAEAENLFRKAIRLDPTTIMAYHNMGNVCLQSGKVDSAIGWYSRALEIDSTSILSLDGLGMALIRKGDLTSARTIAFKLIRENPAAPDGYERLAQIYFRVGDRQNSLENLKKAARLGSSFARNFLEGQKISW